MQASSQRMIYLSNAVSRLEGDSPRFRPYSTPCVRTKLMQASIIIPVVTVGLSRLCAALSVGGMSSVRRFALPRSPVSCFSSSLILIGSTFTFHYRQELLVVLPGFQMEEFLRRCCSTLAFFLKVECNFPYTLCSLSRGPQPCLMRLRP